jgi:hypothetical protein
MAAKHKKHAAVELYELLSKTIMETSSGSAREIMASQVRAADTGVNGAGRGRDERRARPQTQSTERIGAYVPPLSQSTSGFLSGDAVASKNQ